MAPLPLQVIIIIFLQFLIGQELEVVAGWLRVAIVYFFSALGGLAVNYSAVLNSSQIKSGEMHKVYFKVRIFFETDGSCVYSVPTPSWRQSGYIW